ncbi:S-layer homology domain-containing protein [Enorma phocaeensis]|uniref:S-layer homology domain-containing protein n=1 Tax=Enorma phocaeensis TaxID=1871019 RepID=UPI001956ED7C|nr:S-layer homology domain-containing protein [Enorma phocaeensis]MBM6953980.1 S-layer homology domain-containing protein [Enorma phocaeensis]
MTACVKNHSKRVALAISASLVGALTLGAAAPAVAFADEGVSTLASTDSAVDRAEVTYVGGEANQTFMFDGLTHGLIPTKVEYSADLDDLVYAATPDKEVRNEGEFYYFYIRIQSSGWAPDGVTYTDADGNEHDVQGETVYSLPTEPGTYATVVARWDGNGWDAFVADAAAFTIAAKDLTASTIYQGDDVTDTAFEYTGVHSSLQAQNFKKQIGVAINGVAVDTDELTMNIYDAKGKKLTGTTELVPGNTYTVAYQWEDGTDHTERTFKLEKMDLAKTAIIGKAITKADWTLATNNTNPNVVEFDDVVEAMNGVQNDSGDGDFDWAFEHDSSVELKVVEAPGGVVNRHDNGVYTVEMTAKEGDKYVDGSTTFEVYVGDKTADVEFDNMDLWQGDHYYVDLNDDDQAFDLSNIIAKVNSSTASVIKNKELDIKVLNADATAADADALTKPGTHYVVVTYNKKVNDVPVVASEMVKVVTSYTVDVAGRSDIYMSYDGKNVEYAAEDVYTGEDLAKKMAFKVTAGDKTLVQGEDYTVTFKKVNDKGELETVEAVVDAGQYYVFVDGVSYSGQTIFGFRVNPLKPAYAVPVWDLKTSDDPATVYPDGVLIETGAALSPSFTFYDADGNEVQVPEGSYSVDSYDLMKCVWVDGKPGHYEWQVAKRDVEPAEAGMYQAHISNSGDFTNYDLAGLSIVFEVTDKGVFADVPASGVWYSQWVYDAQSKGYMTGYSGSQLFGPNDSIKRGDVAVVLFKMAGGELEFDMAQDEGKDTSDIKFETGFGDVNANAYYAQAIQWAKKVGIVTGYDGTDSFAPEASVSRQELATMLARYAKMTGVDTDADLSALDAYTDGASVADFADEAVAWAVEAGVMGQDVTALRPADAISRAEVAAMTVRVQPDGKLDPNDYIK